MLIMDLGIYFTKGTDMKRKSWIQSPVRVFFAFLLFLAYLRMSYMYYNGYNEFLAYIGANIVMYVIFLIYSAVAIEIEKEDIGIIAIIFLVLQIMVGVIVTLIQSSYNF